MSKIYKSAEDYLETILVLSQQLKYVRSIDIVNELQYSKPSVSIAMKKLRESGHILVDESGYITLTAEGDAIAQRIYHRHNVLSSLLMHFGVSEDVAYEDACKIEHILSEETFTKIHDYALANNIHRHEGDYKHEGKL